MLFVLHIAAFLLSLATIVRADASAMAWVRGAAETLDARRVRRLHLVMWSGLGALVATGVLMAYPTISSLLASEAFIVKMLFVGVLLTNSVLIGRLQHVATERPFRSLTREEKMPLFISGAASALGWTGAFVMAFFLYS